MALKSGVANSVCTATYVVKRRRVEVLNIWSYFLRVIIIDSVVDGGGNGLSFELLLS